MAPSMEELHENEQYFFDEETLRRLHEFSLDFKSVCVLCAPSLGEYMSKRREGITILDIDSRFEKVKGFVRFDLKHPSKMDRIFDIIICDPPFFNFSLSEIVKAINALSRHDFSQPLLITYLKRREKNRIHVHRRHW